MNKVIHGDCLEVMGEIPNESIDLVVTDPPYGMSFVSNYRNIKHKAIENDDSLEWVGDFVSHIHRVLKQDTHAYVFCSFHHVDVFKKELQKLFNVKNILIWEKNNTGMGDLLGDYAPKYEMIIYCHKGTKKLNGGRDANILRTKKTGNNLHPTEKPVDLIEFLIDKSSSPGDMVLDCFAGSGTTAVAALNTKRNYICIEKDEDYFNVINERIASSNISLF